MKKRLLSILLVFSFILPLIPFTAVAAGSDTLCMNFKEITTAGGLAIGTTYLFLTSKYSSSAAVVSIPAGSAQLKITETGSCTITPEKYVDVVQKGTGFDTCTQGGIKYQTNGWYYWCSGGGVTGAGPYYAYSYDTVTFAADDVTVTPKRVFDLSDTITPSDLTVKIMGYTITDYSIPDNTVNGSDRTYTLQIGGVTVSKRAGYIITYTTDASSSGSTTTALKNEGSPIYVPASDGTYAGHYFKGWSLTPASQTVNYLPGSEFNVDVDTILYAVWAPNVYFTVTIDGTPQQVQSGTTVTAPGTSPSRATEYYNASGAVIAGADDTTADAVKKVAYTFAGWKNTATGQIWDFSTPITGPLNLMPSYSETVSYKVSFSASGYSAESQWIMTGSVAAAPGTSPSKATEYYNASGALLAGEDDATPDAAKKIIYTFGGWKNSATGQTWNFNTPVTGAVTLVPDFNATVSYKVRFDKNNAVSTYTSGDQWIQAGQHVTSANAPATVSDGSPAVTYYFAGWNTKADGSGELWNFDGDVVNSRVTLYAQWNTVDSYNITFDDNLTHPIDDYVWYTGSLTANGVAATDCVTLPPDMKRVDYKLDGWYTNPECNASNVYIMNSPLSANNAAGLDTDKDKCITLYAKWTPEYTSENDVLVSDSALQGGTYARFYSSSLNAFVNNASYNTPAATQIYRNFFLVSKTGTTVSPSTLPAGLYLNKRTGEVYGVPAEVGDFTFYVRIANDEDKWISLTYPITVSIAKAPVTVDMKDDNTGLGKVYGENDPGFYSSQLTVAETGTSEITYYDDGTSVQFSYDYSKVIGNRTKDEDKFNPSDAETLKYAPDLSENSFIPANKVVVFSMEYGRTGGEDAGAYKLSMAPAGITCNVISNYDITIAEDLRSTALTYSGSELTTAPEYVFTVSTKPGMSYIGSAAAEYGTYASGDDVKATLTGGAGLVGNNNIKVTDGFQSVVLASGNVSTAGKLKAGTYNSGFTPIIVNTAVPRGTNSAENATTPANYATPTFSLTISPKALTVAGKDTSMAVGLTFTVSDLSRLIDLGYIPGDKVGITLTSLEVGGNTYNLTDNAQKDAANAALAALTKAAGTYALTIGYSSELTGVDAGNYSITAGFVEGVKFSIYSVYMPGAPVVLYEVTGSGTGSGSTGNDEHGTVASDVAEAAAGSNVNLTAVPENGYRLGGVRILDAKRNVIGYTDNGNGSFTFKMPDSGVTFEYYFTLNAADPDSTGVSKVLNTADHNAYLSGYPDGTLNPEGNMTRAEAAQMFYNLLSARPTGSTLSFPDVNQGDWFYQAVTAMTQLGIVDGHDGSYNPNKNITRAEFITMAVRFAAHVESASNYSDVNKSYWAYSSISAATAYGWISGYDDGLFRPNDQITRAEVSVIMNRVLGRVPDHFFIGDNKLELRSFPDLSSNDWYYYDLADATNGHNFDMSKSNLETWENTK